MFLHQVERVEYQDPWSWDFSERYERLLKKERRVAFFYERPDNSTFRYRVYNIIQTLDALSNDVSASWFNLQDAHHLDKVIAQSDVLVVVRARYDLQVEAMVTRAKQLGKRVLFDCDDLVFDPTFIPMIMRTLDLDAESRNVLDYWYAYVGRLSATLQQCDAVITTNAFLGERASQCTGKPYYIVPNFLNCEQLEISSRVYEGKVVSGFARDNAIHIGYFSGSPSHNKDFETVSGILRRIVDKDPRVTIRVAGYLEVKGALAERMDRVERIPFNDFINLQSVIGETEINIAPLQDNTFTNCKSELKFFEAAIVGTLTIATPTFTFRNAIQDGQNGLLSNTFEWEEKLFDAIADLSAGGKRYQEIAHMAYRDVMKRYTSGAMLEPIMKALFPDENHQVKAA